MKTNGPLMIKVAAVCLIALILVSAVWSLATSFGLVRIGGAFGSAQILGGRPNGGFPQGNFRNDGNTQPPGNFQPPENFRNGAGPNFAGRTGFSNIFRATRVAGIGLNVAALLLGTVAVIGLFKHTKWGVVLAIILAVLLGLSSLFGVFRIMLPLVLIQSIVKLVLAIAVVVLLLLPATRKVYQPAALVEADDDDDEDGG